jgi:molybdenum cofactor synthesis domain-containing protein
MTAEVVPTAAALVIGNEILSGKVQDTNSRDLALLLRRLGVRLETIVVIPDDRPQIAEKVRHLSKCHDWLFTSGGVGPTHDDVTIEAVSDAFGVRAVTDEATAELIRRHYGARCTDGHLRMALVPDGANLDVIESVRWPTVRMRNTFVLPGIPEVFRMKLAVVEAVIGRHRPFVSHAVYTKMDEGDLKPLLDAVVARFPAVDVGSYPTWTDTRFRTKLTFDSLDEDAVVAAKAAFLAALPAGEPQWTDP